MYEITETAVAALFSELTQMKEKTQLSAAVHFTKMQTRLILGKPSPHQLILNGHQGAGRGVLI